MKKTILLLLTSLLSANMSWAEDGDEAKATRWDFVTVPSADAARMSADANWKVDSKSRYCYTPAMNTAPAMANGDTLDMAKGLLFTIPANADGSLRFGGTTKALWMGYASGSCTLTIPGCKGGDWIALEYMTSKKGTTRVITATNIVGTLPSSSSSSTHEKGQAKVSSDGDVTLSVGEGMYFYSLCVGDSAAVFEGGNAGGGSGTSPDNPDNPKDTLHVYAATNTADFTVLHTSMIGNGPKIYVSPEGNDGNDGASPETPIQSIQLAIDKAVDPGTTIILAPGEYHPTERLNIDNRNGTHDNYNSMVCLDGRATISCNHPQHGHSDNPYQGIRLTSSYWYFYHVDVTNASDNGMLIERNKPTGGSSADIATLVDQAHDNIIEACNFYGNGDTGLQMKNLASYNYVINCDSYLNCDEDEGDADGFAPKISVGTGNYFYGCRAYLNSDDGWDVFYKKDGSFGDNQTIIMENCITYKNGFLDETTIAPDGNGNGFKCGSDQGAMNVYLNRCLAVMNKAKGFDQNHNSGDIILNNCTGFTSKENGDKAYSYRIYETINTAEGHKIEVTNCIAINDNDEKDKRASDGTRKASEMGKQGDYGRFQIDETLEGLTVTTSEFAKARLEFFESMDHTQLLAPRDANDNLPEIAFAHIKEGVETTYSYKVNKQTVTVTAKSDDLIDTGSAVDDTTYMSMPVPSIKYTGAAPDLGAYETSAGNTAIAQVSAKGMSGKSQVRQLMNGKLLITVEGASLSDITTVVVYSLSGQKIAEATFRGTSTLLSLPNAERTVIVKIV